MTFSISEISNLQDIPRDMKECSNCRVVKSFSEFPRNKTVKDGYDSWCKECKYDTNKEYKDRTQYHKGYYQKNKVKQKERVTEWSKKNRDATLASQAVFFAIKFGIIERPNKCEVCPKEHHKLLAHHHKGYAEEHWLDVIWMCPSCHRTGHNKERE